MKRKHHRQLWAETHSGDSECVLHPASEDASFRSYFRAISRGQSYILMDAPPKQENIIPFIKTQRLMYDVGLHVPTIHADDPDLGFMLLEDFGNRLYLDALSEDTVVSLYGDAIQCIHTMQQHIPTDNLPLYSEALLRSELQLFIDWFIVQHLGESVTEENQKYLDQLFDTLVNNALEQPQHFVHRDYHSRNLMVTKHNSPGILDFQDAILGPVTYDLVSLLRDCYIRWPHEQVFEWSEAFRQNYNSTHQQDISSEQWQRWFDLMGVQRHLKAIGIFCRLNYRDNKPNFLKDIVRTLDYVIEASKRQPHIGELQYLLDRLLPKIDRL